jgi:hypothetical protein
VKGKGCEGGTGTAGREERSAMFVPVDSDPDPRVHNPTGSGSFLDILVAIEKK